MLYLLFQVWFLLLITFVLGWSMHWLLCCKKTNKKVNKDTSDIERLKTSSQNKHFTHTSQTAPGVKPPILDSKPADSDDLKRIKGIGAVIEKTLNELGIYKFAQISAWHDNNEKWIESHIAFPGRVKREKWVAQAKTLESGGVTEFSKRVDRGELDYSKK